MRDYAQTTDLKDYISGDEYQELQREGKLDPIRVATLNCHFCKQPVTQTEPDKREKVLPCCQRCGIFYEPQWILQDATLLIQIIPRAARDDYTEQNEISRYKPQNTDRTEPRQQEHQQTQTEPQNKPNPQGEMDYDTIYTQYMQLKNQGVAMRAAAQKLEISVGKLQYVIKKMERTKS